MCACAARGQHQSRLAGATFTILQPAALAISRSECAGVVNFIAPSDAHSVRWLRASLLARDYLFIIAMCSGARSEWDVQLFFTSH